MTTSTLTTLRNTTLAALVLATAAACSPPATQVAALPGTVQYTGWVDAAAIPPNADRDHLMISNAGEGN